MRAVAAIPAIALMAGSAIGLLFPDLPPRVLIFALVLAAAVAGWALGAVRPLTLAAAAAVGFCAGGALLSADAWRKASRPPLKAIFEELTRQPPGEDDAGGASGQVLVLTGVLRSDAAVLAEGVSITLDVHEVRAGEGPSAEGGGGSRRGPVHGGAQLFVAGSLGRERAGEWRAGRTLRLPAQLRAPARYRNPGSVDGERILAHRGIALVGSVKSPALVEVVARGHLLAEAAAAARASVRSRVRAGVGRWSSRSAAIVTAILIGDRAGLDPEVETRLQEAGTYHVIAISGGNIAILAGLMLVGFRLAGAMGRAAMLTALVGLLGYGYLAAGGPSVARATVTAVVFLAGRAADLRGPPVNLLALAAGLLTAANPLAVADAGFLLTFGATAGIILLVPALTGPWPGSGIARGAAAMLAASAAAEIALMPVGALLFSRVTVAGLALNFAAIPLMALAQIAGLAVVAIAPALPAAASGAGWFAHAGAEGLVRSADLVQVAPFLTWRVAPPQWTVVALYYLAVTVAFAGWRVRGAAGSLLRLRATGLRGAPQLVAVAAALWIVAQPWTLVEARGNGRLRVLFIDVGQGDATLVRFPRGSTLLVDAGGLTSSSSFDVGDRIVGATLRHLGVRRLDRLAITHGDADHAGGTPSIVREFRPRDVWEGIPVPRLELLRTVRSLADRAAATWVQVQRGDLMEIDGVTLRVLHPPPPDWERQQVRNDDSIVIELRWQLVSVVLAGDIGREVEALVAPQLAGAVPLRIVKVPHHGSLTSSRAEFVRALGPRVAVVSAGRGNPFGHPAPAVLGRYRNAGAAIFRTDEDGAVELETDGRTVEMRTVNGRGMRVGM